MNDFQSQEPVNRPEVLHLEGPHEFVLSMTQSNGIIGENHQVINIESNDTEGAIFGGMNKDGMIHVTSDKPKLAKFLLGLLVPCTQHLLQTIYIRKRWVRGNRALRALGGLNAPRGLRAQGDKP